LLLASSLISCRYGFLPEGTEGGRKVALDPSTPRDIFYRSYLQTYIQRDVRQLARVGDELAFQRCVRAAAARTG
jgi:hypothetical protein